MGSNWFVTGAQGFLGRYVTAHILNSRAEARVMGIGRSEILDECFSHTIMGANGRMQAPLPAELKFSGNPRYGYRSVDLNDQNALGQLTHEFRPDFVVHMAAGLRGDERRHLLRTNVEGTGFLIDSLCDTGCSAIVIGSSGGVYGCVSPDRLPLTETELCIPADEYAVSKLAAEQLARVLVKNNQIRLPIARIFNAVGPGQDERHVAGRIASQFAAVLKGRSQSVKLGVLHPTRDFIDVRDVARALVLLAETPSASGPINVGSGQELSVRKLVEVFNSVAGMRLPIESEDGLTVDVPRHYANIEVLTNLGFRCAFTINQSVESLLAYFKQVWSSGSQVC